VRVQYKSKDRETERERERESEREREGGSEGELACEREPLFCSLLTLLKSLRFATNILQTNAAF
jgi:hypothetical protein